MTCIPTLLFGLWHRVLSVKGEHVKSEPGRQRVESYHRLFNIMSGSKGRKEMRRSMVTLSSLNFTLPGVNLFALPAQKEYPSSLVAVFNLEVSRSGTCQTTSTSISRLQEQAPMSRGTFLAFSGSSMQIHRSSSVVAQTTMASLSLSWRGIHIPLNIKLRENSQVRFHA